MSKSAPAPAPLYEDSSFASPSHSVRPKRLALHDSKILAEHDRNSAQTLDSDAPDSCHRIATRLLRQSRNELDFTQERAAALIETHPISLGRRERGQVELGALRDWVKLVREIVRAKGPDAASAFLASFVDALAQGDKK